MTGRDIRRLSAGALVAVALVVALVVGTGPVPAVAVPPAEAVTATGYVVPELQWGPCAWADPALPLADEIQCADALVPLDHERPDGALVSIALSKVPANGTPEQRIGTLFYNPGGPGGAGTRYGWAQASRLSPEMRAAFDVVGFDPRGVGDSRPAPACNSLQLGLAPWVSGDPASWSWYVDEVRELNTPIMTSCAVANAGWISHVGTVDVARDLDLLRAAVGDELLTYDGVSYGTRIGSVYAQLFPDRVRAMVLDGNMDPMVDVPELFTQATAKDDAFALFRTWAPAAGQQYDEVMAVLALGPVSTPIGDIDTYSFRLEVADRLGAEWSWYGLVETIDGIHQAVVGGAPGSVVAAAVVPSARRVDPIGFGDPPELESPVLWAVDCQDNPGRPSDDVYEALSASQFTAGSLWGFAPGVWIPVCSAAGAIPVHTIPRLAHLSTPPILVTQARHDPITSFAWAQSLFTTLPSGSRMVVYEGANHGVYGGLSACVDAVADAYLLDGTLPATDVSCPFLPPAP